MTPERSRLAAEGSNLSVLSDHCMKLHHVPCIGWASQLLKPNTVSKQSLLASLSFCWLLQRFTHCVSVVLLLNLTAACACQCTLQALALAHAIATLAMCCVDDYDHSYDNNHNSNWACGYYGDEYGHYYSSSSASASASSG